MGPREAVSDQESDRTREETTIVGIVLLRDLWVADAHGRLEELFEELAQRLRGQAHM